MPSLISGEQFLVKVSVKDGVMWNLTTVRRRLERFGEIEVVD